MLAAPEFEFYLGHLCSQPLLFRLPKDHKHAILLGSANVSEAQEIERLWCHFQ